MDTRTQLGKAADGAEMLGVTIQRFYKLIRDGEFEKDGVIVRVGEAQIRVRLDALERYIERGGRKIEVADVAA